MPIIEAFKLHAVAVGTDMIDGVESRDYDGGVDVLKVAGSGKVTPGMAAVNRADPKATVTSTNIAAVLDAISQMSGYKIGASTAAVTLWWKAFEQGAAINAGNAHQKAVAELGLVVLRSISASKDSPAQATFEIIPVSSDGVTHPFAVTKDAALVLTPLESIAWTVGKVTINGTDFLPSSITIDFGTEVMIADGGGDPYSTFAAIEAIAPMVTVTGLDAQQLADLDLGGEAITTVKVWLRKYAAGARRVADGTAEHILFTMTAGVIVPEGSSGSASGPDETTLKFEAADDASNDIIQVDTAAAIS